MPHPAQPRTGSRRTPDPTAARGAHRRRTLRRGAALCALLLTPATAACSADELTPEQLRSMHPTPSTAAATPVPAVELKDQPYAMSGVPEQRLDLSVPGGRRGPRPVVVLIHGGGWETGEKELFERSDGSNMQALRTRLLQQGWATASIDYRLSGAARMPAQLDDVKAAIRWVYAHAGRYGLDRERIAVLGESAGGHLAQLAGDTRDQPRAEGHQGILEGASSHIVAVVSLYGVSDLRHMVSDRVAAGCGEVDAGPTSAEGRLLGGDPAAPDMASRADAASPVGHISNTSAPTLFLHGRQDCTVPAAQSERASDMLRAAGVHAPITVVDGVHSDRKFYTDPKLQQEVIDFLRTYLWSPPPATPAESGASETPTASTGTPAPTS